MKLLFWLFICCVFVLFQHSYSVDIQCEYISGPFSYLGTIYYCSAESININSRQDAIINKISGAHLSGKNNDDVLGFAIYGTNIPYFLKLETHFKNLKGIIIYTSHLKEIHQSDLMPFPNLVGLYLYNNDIEIIEDGLFLYNPNLVVIWLQSNKIIYIHPNVFDSLSKLNYLHLGSNTCIDKNASNPTEVKELIQQIKSQTQCRNTEYSNFESKLKNLKSSTSSLNSQTFKDQLAEIEAEIKNSKYADYLTTQIEALKAVKIDDPTTTTTSKPSTTTTTTTSAATTTQMPTTATTTTSKPCICEPSNQTTCAKVCDMKPVLDEIKDLRASNEDQKSSQNETFLNFEDKIQFIEENLISFQASTAKRLQTIEDDQKLSEFRLSKKIDAISRKFDAMEEKLEKIIEAINNKD